MRATNDPARKQVTSKLQDPYPLYARVWVTKQAQPGNIQVQLSLSDKQNLGETLTKIVRKWADDYYARYNTRILDDEQKILIYKLTKALMK